MMLRPFVDLSVCTRVAGVIFFIASTPLLSAQVKGTPTGSAYGMLKQKIAAPKSSFGFQVSPFVVASNNLGASILLADSMQVSIDNLANANPSLQGGFFFERQVSERWRFRGDVNLMHRSIWYRVVDNPWLGFFQTRITVDNTVLITINTPIVLQYRFYKRLHLSGGFAAQFHFGSREFENPRRPDLVVISRLRTAHRDVTLHFQYGLHWHMLRWSVGFSVQQSMTPLTTGFEYLGDYYRLPELNTKMYFLNLGYRILPPLKKWRTLP